jgi:hypothetical protein
MRGLILLSHGRLDGNSQNENAEQGETEHARTETIQGQILLGTVFKYRTADGCNQ